MRRNKLRWFSLQSLRNFRQSGEKRRTLAVFKSRDVALTHTQPLREILLRQLEFFATPLYVGSYNDNKLFWLHVHRPTIHG